MVEHNVSGRRYPLSVLGVFVKEAELSDPLVERLKTVELFISKITLTPLK